MNSNEILKGYSTVETIHSDYFEHYPADAFGKFA